MANVLPREKQLHVLHLLVEGTSLRSITRLTGIHRTTVMNLMLRFGDRCRDFLDRTLVGLHLEHIQCDEIWTFVRKKQKMLRDDERGLADVGDVYCFTALDTASKLVVTYALGKRNSETTEAFIGDLSRRLVLPESVNAPWDAKPQISTDGWSPYPDAVFSAFGSNVRFGTIVKNYVNPEVGRYAPPEIVNCDRRPLQGISNARTICTSHVERHNLSIRTFLKRFARLSLGFSKKLDNLAAAVALYVAFYDFCWRHGTLRVTPAMAAGVVDELWTLDRLYDTVMG